MLNAKKGKKLPSAEKKVVAQRSNIYEKEFDRVARRSETRGDEDENFLTLKLADFDKYNVEQTNENFFIQQFFWIHFKVFFWPLLT